MPQNVKTLNEKKHQQNQEYIQKVQEKVELQKQGKEVPQELQTVVVPQDTPHNQKADGQIFPVLGLGSFILIFAVVLAAVIGKRIKKSKKDSKAVIDTDLEFTQAAYRDKIKSLEAQLEMNKKNQELEERLAQLESSISSKESELEDLHKDFENL